MALAGVATGLISLLAELRVRAAIIQFPDLKAAELNTAFWATLLLSALLYAAMYLAAPHLAGYFSISILSPLLRVIGLGALLNVVRIVPDRLLRKRLYLDKVAIVDIVSAAANILLMLGLAWGRRRPVGACGRHGVWAVRSVRSQLFLRSMVAGASHEERAAPSAARL